MAGFINLKKRGWATRGVPNVIIPTLSDSISTYDAMGQSWAWPAAGYYETIKASLAYEFLLTSLFVNLGLGAQKVAGETWTYQNNICQFQVAKGRAGSEVNIAEGYSASSQYLSVAGWVNDNITVTILDTATRTVGVKPVRVPTASRLSFRTTISGTAVIWGGQLYATGYDLRTFDFAHVHAFDDLFMRGMRPCYPMDRPLAGDIDVVTGVGYMTLGAWVEVIASIEDDCLVDKGMVAIKLGEAANSVQLEIGLGPDNTHVVVQGRYAICPSATYEGVADCDLPLPFIAYKGEKLWIRAADANGLMTLHTGVHAVRLR
jgi:hypothetical protein